MTLFRTQDSDFDGLFRILGSEVDPTAVIGRRFNDIVFRHFDQHRSNLYYIPRVAFGLITTVAQPCNGSEPVVDSDVVYRFVCATNSSAFSHNARGYSTHEGLNVAGKRTEITQ